MDYNLLRYNEGIHKVCTKNFTRRQLYDLERYVFIYPSKIQVCSCLTNPWAKETLSFLGAQWCPATEQCTTPQASPQAAPSLARST
jgi:hypothetical protein